MFKGKLTKIAIAFVLLLTIATVVLAGSVSGYYYYINGNEYTVGGGTYYPGGYSSYIRSETFSGYSPGSPSILFQSLVLNTRTFTNSGCPPPVSTRNGTCVNCTYTNINNIVPPSGTPLSNYISASKHKLQDTRATNYYGNPPSPFYTEGATNGAASQSIYQGGVFGCSPAYSS